LVSSIKLLTRSSMVRRKDGPRPPSHPALRPNGAAR
jgi:hypothetical protein